MFFPRFFLLLLITGLPLALSAEEPSEKKEHVLKKDTRMVLGIGDYNFLDDNQSVEYRIEWHGGEFWRNFRPLAGYMTSADDAHYFYGGVVSDFYLTDSIIFSLQSGIGYYEEGDGKDLGHEIEFKSAAEIAWQFSNRARLGLQLYHLSNAGIDRKNPGTEILGISYTIPLSDK